MVRIAVTNPCRRCLKPTPSVATEILNWGDLRYKIALCQKHHMQLEKELRTWTNLAELIDETEPAPLMRPVADEHQNRPPSFHRPRPAERLPIPILDGGVEEEAELPLWQDELPPEAKDLAGMPELAEWRMSRKALEKAGEVGIDILAAMMTAAMPESVEPDADGDPDIELHVRGSIYALVSLSTKKVITVFRRGEPRAGSTRTREFARF